MPNAHQWIDLSYLKSIAGGDKEIIDELIMIFLDQIPEFTEGLHGAFQNKEWTRVAAIAHKAKSSVLSMGMEELGNEDLKNLELLAKEMRVRELKESSSSALGKGSEQEKLEKNLRSYPIDRQKWVIEHCSEDEISKLIRKFEQACVDATEELQSELEK